MKLILGTVQLGIDYGINKKKPILKQSLEILNYCLKNKIITFDTAQNYGNSENIAHSDADYDLEHFSDLLDIIKKENN